MRIIATILRALGRARRIANDPVGRAESLVLREHLLAQAVVAGLIRCDRHPHARITVHATHGDVTVSCEVCGRLDLAGSRPAPLVGAVVNR